MSGRSIEPSQLVHCFEFGFLWTQARFQVSCSRISGSGGQREAAVNALNSLVAAAIRCVPRPDGDTLISELRQMSGALDAAPTEQANEQFLEAWSEFERQGAESPAMELHDRLTSASCRQLDSIRAQFDRLMESNSLAVKCERLGESLAEGAAPANAALRLAEQVQQMIRETGPTVRGPRHMLRSLTIQSHLYLRVDFESLPLVPDSGWHLNWRAHWDVCALGDVDSVVPEPENWDSATTRDFVERLRSTAIQRLRAASSLPEDATFSHVGSAPLPPIRSATAADLPAGSAAAASDPAMAAPFAVQQEERDPIVYHRGRTYSRGDAAPVEVSDREHNVLQVFVGQDASLSLKKLEQESGRPRADRVLANLEASYGGRFRSAIRRPGHRGMGGYRVHIVAMAVISAPTSALDEE